MRSAGWRVVDMTDRGLTCFVWLPLRTSNSPATIIKSLSHNQMITLLRHSDMITIHFNIFIEHHIYYVYVEEFDSTEQGIVLDLRTYL